MVAQPFAEREWTQCGSNDRSLLKSFDFDMAYDGPESEADTYKLKIRGNDVHKCIFTSSAVSWNSLVDRSATCN